MSASVTTWPGLFTFLGSRETINCGCVSLPFMDSWGVANPGRKPYTEEELRLNPNKRDMAGGKTVAQALAEKTAKSAKLNPMGTDAYEIAKAGGRQFGLIKQLPNYGPNQMRKALASQEARVREHLEKIANPERYCEGWAERSKQYREGLLRKWRGEAADANEQIAVIEGYRNEHK